MDSPQSALQVGPRATGSQPFGTPNRGLPSDENASKSNNPLPAVTVPKGGGAIRGLDEKYAVNPTSGTVTMSIPIPITPGRSGFQPVLNLAYSSGSGNSPFGMGWSLEIPRITRKTDKGIPKYDDSPNAVDCDVYLMGGEDLVPTFARDEHGSIELDEVGRPVVVQEQRADYVIVPFSPRVEASFTRIERWTRVSDPGQVHWRTITGDNVTSIFGRDDKSRISDPSAPDRIFSWLISETYSVEGNAAIFEYKREDSSSVPLDRAHEAGRTDVTRSANCYLKCVRYGNRVPNRDKGTWTPFSAFALEQSTWMFSLVLDYGEHDSQNPTTKEIRPWSYRQDAFSSYKSGFEIRTYRLCHRFLMFHHFQELGQRCLTKSTDLQYEENSFGTYLTGATLVGYALDSKQNQYNRQSLPPLEFSYSRLPTDDALADLLVHEIDAESLENIPHGVGGSSYQFLDLDGEGLPGIFVEQADGWYYKRNSTVPVSACDGPTIPRFDPLRSVDPRPSATLTSGRARFADLAGDGHLDVVATESGVWSYSERIEDEGWSVFVNMRSVPNVDLRNPNLRLLDVTGDGLADIVIDDEAVFIIYPSIGEEGYEGPISVAKALDEDHGPRIVFADVSESIYLADVSGDGLVDILRIRNGDVCYWPNMGYGRFGSKVVMENAPRFDSDEQFSQRNLHIADIDGSGTSDLIYIGRRGIEMYLNQAGNAFASPKIVPGSLRSTASARSIRST